MSSPSLPDDPLGALRRFVPRSRDSRAETEKCEMCSAPLDADHAHIASLEGRGLLCICRPCQILFEHQGAGRGKFRPVRDRVAHGPGLGISEGTWNRLALPVRMVFFFFNSELGRPVAFYPSPAGAIQADLGDDAWHDLESASTALSSLAPDVEAWLLDGRDRARIDGYVVPVPSCYELVAHVRLHWRGLDGGEEARARIDAFFARLRERALVESDSCGGVA